MRLAEKDPRLYSKGGGSHHDLRCPMCPMNALASQTLGKIDGET